ncbi:hypothetical protein [Nocardioides sp. Arc9.136]|uniref:hypothetical protein n=1 Tax=Nocardioides sp. Arc9.136 TaxID=2996826 RepID=UPI00266702A6|nr:hypothetical protein [Nocardioides sp. Arc9.136]WKN47124.1 hypothetical protein OSR43_13860 [Nocardioides sp. Arc9.136]
MATKLAQVRVTAVAAGTGHLITCSQCALSETRGLRSEADQLAVDHQRSHVRSTAASQHDGLALR